MTAIVALPFIVEAIDAMQTAHTAMKITGKMKAVCVGRFLIDAPASAQVTHGVGSVGGLDIAAVDGEAEEEYAYRVREIDREISEKTKQDGEASRESVQKLPAGAGAGKAHVDDQRHAKVVEGEMFVTQDLLPLRSILRFADVSVTGRIDRVPPEYIAGIVSVLERICLSGSGEIPKDAGLCLGHAMIQNSYERENVESAVMFAGIPGHPDVHILSFSMTGTRPAPGLWERNASAASREPLFMRLALPHLRRQKRAINGIPGEELVMRIREPNFTTAYSSHA